MKILFCTDGSKISFNSLENFSKWHKSATVDIICVIDWSFLPDEVYIEESGFANSCANIACSILENAKQKVIDLGMNLNNTYRVCGSAVDSIEEQLQKEKYDLVLLGSHGKKGIQKWLGSVSREITTNSNISAYISSLWYAKDTDSAGILARERKVSITRSGFKLSVLPAASCSQMFSPRNSHP